MATIVNPDSLAAPRGYSNGVVLPAGRVLFVAGQVGWNREAQIVADDMPAQFEQALRNIVDVVTAAGGAPEHIGRMTIYVTDKQKYIDSTRAIGEAYRRLIGRHYPAMTLVQVAALLEEGALVEIEATAVLP